MGFIRFILIAVLVYYILKLLFSLIFGHFIKGFYSQGSQQNKGFRNTGKREGDITIDYMPKQNKIVDKNEGEYVDYEDLKK